MSMREEEGRFPDQLHAHAVEQMRQEIAEMDLPQLRARVEALLDEVFFLRRQRMEREDMVGQLRDANENLVIATLNAQTLREEAEAVNRRQNEFLAMLAHELRNPLSPISMAAALIRRTPDASPQLAKLQEVITRQVEHMGRLLDDLLDAARISSGKITLSLDVVPLADVAARAIETVQPRLDERRQLLHVVLPLPDVMVEGDPVRLTQIFTNLLANASKYTRDYGRIGFIARADDDTVVVTVEDNGEGIPADVMPHIFDLFIQGPRSLARSEGGLGVGLNIVRNLIHMHGGQVEADSAGPGKGSRFTVTLPRSRKALHEEGVPAAVSNPAKSCRILLIEDNLDACDTLKSFLELEGHAVATAHEGNAGLAAALEQPPDVLICDIGLPGMDGLAVIEQLRLSAGGARPFAIALSGYGQAQDRIRAIDAGFDRYLVKPVDPVALSSLIASEDCQHRKPPT